MNQRPRAEHSAEAASTARGAITDLATTARVDSKLWGSLSSSQRIPSHVLYLSGGLFVLILFIGFIFDFSGQGIEHGIPNNALAALVLPAYSPVRDALIRIAPALASLETLAKYDVAVVVQSDPLLLHTIVYTPRPEDLLALSQAGLQAAPIGDRLVVIGDQAAAARFRRQARLPWWTRLRIAWIKKQHAGALLFARDAESPWLLGNLEEQDAVLYLTAPLAQAGRYTSRALETDVQDTLFNLTRLFLPATFTLKLPDNYVAQELRTEISALSWSIKEENGPTYTLFQNNSPIFSYRRMDQGGSCSNTPPQRGVLVTAHSPLPELTLEISLLKQAILFCISLGDKL